jgi:hypothetical protein
MADVFLSYANEDAEHARVLAEALSRVGWSVWWDHHIPPGKSWSEVIEREIMSAGCVVVLWSRESVRSQWVQNEAREGLSRHVLVPVIGEDGVRLPLEFRHVQAAYLQDWDPEDERSEYAQLVASIRDVLRRGTAVPEEPRPAPPPPRRSHSKWPWIAAGGVLVALLALLAAWLWPVKTETGSVAATTEPATVTESVATIAPPQTDTGPTRPKIVIPRPTIPRPTTVRVTVGTLSGGTAGCVAFLVAHDLALTDPSCVPGARRRLSVSFGAGEKMKRYSVTVAERDPVYLLLRLSSAADRVYPVIALDPRQPKAEEPVRVFTGTRTISCTMYGVSGFRYDCPSTPAPGAPVFDAGGLLLGMHRRQRSGTLMEGVELRSIVDQSPLL